MTNMFYYLCSTILIIIGVISLFYILIRWEKPYVAKKHIMCEPKIKQTYTHSFEYDETEGCKFYIVREHPSGKIVTKEKI